MVNKTKILSELSKILVDAMSTLSDFKKEAETIIKLRVEKVINRMNLVKRDEFEVLKKIVQKLDIENDILRKKSAKTILANKKKKKKRKVKK